MPEIIIDKYCKIFRDCLEEELAVTEEKAMPVVTEITSGWTTRTLLFAFGDPAELAKITETIFTNSDVRDFVYGLTMRFIVKISGNEDISFPQLVSIVTSWAIDDDTVVRATNTVGRDVKPSELIDNECLIPKEIPESTRKILLGVNSNIPLILDVNRFLIVPIMLNIGGLVSVPAPTKNS